MNLHTDDMDMVFRKAYREMKLEPSGNVWNQIRGRLDEHEDRGLVAGKVMVILFLISFPLYLPSPSKNHVLNFPSSGRIDPHDFSSLVPVAVNYLKKVKATEKLQQDANLRAPVIFDAPNTGKSFHLKPYQGNENTFLKSRQSIMRTPPWSSPTTKDHNIERNIKPKRPWAISATIYTGRTKYRIDNDLPRGSQQTHRLNEREEPESSYSVSITIEKLFSESFGWQSGLIFSHSTISIDPQHIYAMYGPQGDIGYKFNVSPGYAFIKPPPGAQPTIGDSLAATEAEHEFQSVGIPIKLLYQHNIGKFTLKPAVGVVGNFVTKSILETEVEDGFAREIVNVSKLKGTRSFFWSLVADAEVQYQLKDDYHIHIRPSINLGISSMTENHEVEAFPTDIRVGIGITRKF